MALQGVELVVAPLLFQKLKVRAFFNDLSVRKNDDFIRVLDDFSYLHFGCSGIRAVCALAV